MYNPIVTNLILVKVNKTLCSWDKSLIQFINSRFLQLQGLRKIFLGVDISYSESRSSPLVL